MRLISTKSWRQLEDGVVDYYTETVSEGLHMIVDSKLEEKATPEIHLWLSVLINAGKHRDMDFINTCGPKICKLCSLDFRTIHKAFQYVWEIEDAHYQK